MKRNIKRKVVVDLDLTLDSSEAIMFTKGGRHKINIDLSELFYDDVPLCDYEVNISIQLERNQQGRFDFITSE